MFPVLFSISDFEFATIWLFIFFSVLVFAFIVFVKSEEEAMPVDKVFDLILISAISAAISGRFLKIVLENSGTLSFFQVVGDPIINLWGAIGGAILAILIFSKKFRLNYVQILDFCATGFILAAAIFSFGRIIWQGANLTTILVLSIFLAGSVFFYFAGKKIQFPGFFILLGLLLISLTEILTQYSVKFKELNELTRNFNLIVSFSVLTFSAGLFYKRSERDFFEDLKMIGRNTLQVFKKARLYLVNQRKLLENQLAKLRKDDPFFAEGREQSRESGEDAYEFEGHERITVLREDLKRGLLQVKKALAAIGLGKYGRCEKCGAKIDVRRLKVYPEATLCLSCERRLEKS